MDACHELTCVSEIPVERSVLEGKAIDEAETRGRVQGGHPREIAESAYAVHDCEGRSRVMTMKERVFQMLLAMTLGARLSNHVIGVDPA